MSAAAIPLSIRGLYQRAAGNGLLEKPAQLEATGIGQTKNNTRNSAELILRKPLIGYFPCKDSARNKLFRLDAIPTRDLVLVWDRPREDGKSSKDTKQFECWWRGQGIGSQTLAKH
ncbi:uncharacterized protein PADG_06482 [Paracoccidioides brasiliensis Pb18]|uniref:Uncharacterized protein n=1 Tax=Paracoccidioides brasiliensis (strain Pb18) TaxID=502780 RepID=C1GGP5_PARBD|nr:uncharacterized protein PADG_06482 [Paracoccidioides brasiliensis Pb18]EEH50403.2 hypothetical protein PADG_06482 [Paracoccidioides brasiliensis Pb18]